MRFVDLRRRSLGRSLRGHICHLTSNSSPREILKSLLNDGNTAAWFYAGAGQTVTGSGVSTWADQSGNGRDLTQGCDAARPALLADGSVLFNGTSHYLKSGAFTLNQPETVYLVANPVTWTNADYIYDGLTNVVMALFQNNSSPEIYIRAGAVLNGVNFTVGAYGILTVQFNGASSDTQYNADAPITGNAGASNAGGLTLGANGGNTNWANVQVKEWIIRATVDSAATRLAIQTALNREYSLF